MSIILFNFTKELLSNWSFLIIYIYVVTSNYWFYCEVSSHSPTASYLHICMSHAVGNIIKNEMWKKSLKFLLIAFPKQMWKLYITKIIANMVHVFLYFMTIITMPIMTFFESLVSSETWHDKVRNIHTFCT